MARKTSSSEEIFVELLMRVEGSADLTRITTFKLPLVGRVEGDDETPGQVQFESRTLIRRIKEALNKLL